MLAVYASVWILQKAMAERGFSAALYWVLNTVFASVGFALCPGGGFFVFCGVLISAALAPRDISKGQIVFRLDTSVACICLFAFLADADLKLMLNSNARDALAILIISFAALLFAMIPDSSQESDAGRGTAGKMVLGMLIAGLSLAASAFVKLTGGGMQGAAQSTVNFLGKAYMALISVFGRIVGVIWRFIMWLSSLGSGTAEDIPLPPPEKAPELDIPLDKIPDTSPWWFKLILIAFAAFVIGLVLYKLSKRKVKLSARKPMAKPAVKRQSRTLDMLKKAYLRFSDSLSYSIMCLCRRNTVPGLVSAVEKRIKLTRKNMARRACESPQFFLRRIADEYENESVRTLADLCELHFYAGRKQSVSRELVSEIRRFITGIN